MTIVFNADTGVTTPGLTNSGSSTVSGTLQVGGITTNLYPLVSGTAVTLTTQTSVDFTSIPSWVKRITVMFNGVSTSGTSNVQIQIGAGSVTTSGYVGGANVFTGAGVGTNTFTSGFVTEGTSGGITSSTVRHGLVTIDLVTGNTWVASGVLQHTGTSTGGSTAGSLALGGTLDRVRITTVNGTDQLDAGSINVMWE